MPRPGLKATASSEPAIALRPRIVPCGPKLTSTAEYQKRGTEPAGRGIYAVHMAAAGSPNSVLLNCRPSIHTSILPELLVMLRPGMAPSRSVIFAMPTFQIIAADLGGGSCVILQALLQALNGNDDFIYHIVLSQSARGAAMARARYISNLRRTDYITFDTHVKQPPLEPPCQAVRGPCLPHSAQ